MRGQCPCQLDPLLGAERQVGYMLVRHIGKPQIVDEAPSGGPATCVLLCEVGKPSASAQKFPPNCVCPPMRTLSITVRLGQREVLKRSPDTPLCDTVGWILSSERPRKQMFPELGVYGDSGH